MRLVLLALTLFVLACGPLATRRFPLRDPMLTDTDTKSVRVPCRPGKDGKLDCFPEPYESPIAWDAADNTLLRPLGRALAVDVGGEAVNVNALDEVPDSAWFENRIGVRSLDDDKMFRGPCKVLIDEREWPDGAWVVDQGKADGATPGFRVKIDGLGKFMLKSDGKEQPERASAASAIGMRLYYAAGFHVPCDAVVWFDPKVLKLTSGLTTTTDNSGFRKPFDTKLLQWILDFNLRRGNLVRMQSSQWLAGKPLGPFKYDGVREDDPNDVIPHEDRRELRGARLLAAWINHFDAREQNSMNVWIADDPSDDRSAGWVKHHYLDVSDSFGSEWDWDEISRRLGHSHYLDLAHIGEDFLTLGLIERPWHRAHRDPVGKIFGYFRVDDFVPEKWQAGYPNPAFSRMTEHDAAWMTRILARFTPDHVRAAIRAGRFSRPEHEVYLYNVLLGRQRLILRRYLSRLSPVADVSAIGHRVCAVDLARRSKAFPEVSFAYSATSWVGEAYTRGAKVVVEAKGDGVVCLTVADVAQDGGAPDADLSRYRMIDLSNGHAPGVVRMHFYDLGKTRGLRLVGIERPERAESPR